MKSVPTNHNIKVNKPCQRILVHRFNVCKVGNTEEQDGGVLGDWFVSISGVVDLLLCAYRK